MTTASRAAIWVALCDSVDRHVMLWRTGSVEELAAQRRVINGLCEQARKQGVPDGARHWALDCMSMFRRAGCCGSCVDPDHCEQTKRERLICVCGEPKTPGVPFCTPACMEVHNL